MSNRETIENLFETILSNGFPRLRICTAFDIEPLDFSNTWTGSSNLRALNLNLKTEHDCQQLRSICPQLRRLTTYSSSIVPDIQTDINHWKRVCRQIFSQDYQINRVK